MNRCHRTGRGGGELRAAVAKVLQANRDAYYEIATANSGTVKDGSAVDIDAASQTGHGNVMPQSLHGGPGRAGSGKELGGVRALNFYHRRAAFQASTSVLNALAG